MGLVPAMTEAAAFGPRLAITSNYRLYPMSAYDAANPRRTAALALGFGALCLALHLAANGQYGVFRDELYFIVCGEHFAFGYVDQPPLVPWIAAASPAMFGFALTPFRLPPALALAATVALTVEFAGRLGGGRFAQALAGLCTLLAPVLLADGLLMSTDMLQPLTWLGCSWALVRLSESGDERWWLAFGAIAGVGAMSKYLIAFYLVGLAVGVVVTMLRRSLLKPWVYAGALVALALAAPNLIWQATHGWPFLELARAGAGGKNTAFSPLGYFGEQMLFVGPLTAPVWLAGLWRLARDRSLRAIAIAYLLMFAMFLASHGKPYYLAAIYPTLFAAGAAQWENWVKSRAARVAAMVVLSAAGVATLPMALPVLPPERFLEYAHALRVAPAPMERGAQSVLPQYYADMFGWREMAEEVSRVFRALPEDERAKAVFFGRNYGEAAAIDLYGPEFGGPPAISAHNNYYLWGTRGFDGSVVITLAAPGTSFAPDYGSAEVAGRITNRYAMPYETNLDVYVLRSPREPLATLWPKLRHYD